MLSIRIFLLEDDACLDYKRGENGHEMDDDVGTQR